MAFEVDFLAVGDGEKSGDAIALRFVDNQKQTVVVIDGGTQDSGKLLAQHIKQYYGANTVVEWAILTHPDSDHAFGLTALLEQIKVSNLIMHKPWEHVQAIKSELEKEYTPGGIERKIVEQLQAAKDVEKAALKNGTKVIEAFEGVKTNDGFIHVLGPSKEYYEQTLADVINEIGTPSILYLANEVIKLVRETLQAGSLKDPNENDTSPTNNSSLIILFNFDGYKLLFTGDAGVGALTRAADYAVTQGIKLTDLQFFQVPHHGSKRNVGPTILKRIKANTAFISAAAKSKKHPAKKVTNELRRNGSQVFVTQGKHIMHSFPQSVRPGWGPVDPVPFYEEVED
jgi:beta-lactamase superfamily II metal-dependent hydrolase